MECNKDEAIRAKEIAERKFGENNIAGAKKFASKAQSLYPGLDGIQQLLATLDVYMCAVNNTVGEPDWYAILGVDPKADDDMVKKQYRKLALSLHPDKNKSVGADGAFNLVKDAWELLSDKPKRAAYERRMNVKVRQNVVHQNASTSSQASQGANGSVHQKASMAQGSQGTNGSAHQKVATAGQGSHGSNGTEIKVKASSAKAQRGTKRAAPSSASDEAIPRSFWSRCPKCKMQFEHLGKYLSYNVFCSNCNKIFQALEIVPPATCDSKSATPSYKGITRTSENVGETGFISHVAFTGRSVIWSPFFRAAGPSQAATVHPQASAGAAGPSRPAKASSVDKRGSRKGKKCNLDEETLQRIRESIARDLDDNARKKRFDAKMKKEFDAKGRRDDDLV